MVSTCPVGPTAGSAGHSQWIKFVQKMEEICTQIITELENYVT
jgi:hypothetical protein